MVLVIVAVPMPSAAAEGTKYVAIGDSFTGGSGLAAQTLDLPGCMRSDRNYPTLLADALDVVAFTDASCAGALTEHVFTAQTTFWGVNPPQIDAVTPDTDLVTIGIGGMDAGFVDIAITCLVLGLIEPQGAPCKWAYNDHGRDELRARIDDAAGDVAAVVDAVHARAPAAEVIVVGYPMLLPAEGGCWINATVAADDVPYLDGVNTALNAMLAEVADGHDAAFADVSERGHSICAPAGDRWIEPVVPERRLAPLHPNALGMRAVASKLLGILGGTR